MELNAQKSMFLYNIDDQGIYGQVPELFLYHMTTLDTNFRYLGYFLKPNHYKIMDRNWMSREVEKGINNWTYRWLSLGEDCVGSVCIGSILVYWLSLAMISVSVIGI